MRDNVGVNQRERILDQALQLMADGGAEAMSMRELATATGVNVATLYYYFPSKRDLLTAVLQQPGYREVLDADLPEICDGDVTEELTRLLASSWRAMLRVQDYVRVMIGETLRGDAAARAVGSDLLETTQDGLCAWLRRALPPQEAGALESYARLLRAVIVGVFIERLAAAPGEDDGWCEAKAAEMAAVLTTALPAPAGMPDVRV